MVWVTGLMELLAYTVPWWLRNAWLGYCKQY